LLRLEQTLDIKWYEEAETRLERPTLAQKPPTDPPEQPKGAFVLAPREVIGSIGGLNAVTSSTEAEIGGSRDTSRESQMAERVEQ